MSKAAPDVDLKAQGGLPYQLVAAGAAATVAVLLYSRAASPGGEDDASAGLPDGEEAAVAAGWASWLAWLVVRMAQVAFSGFALLLGVLVVQQRKILYVPAPPGTARLTSENPGIYQSPTAWGLPYEDVMIPTEDGTRVNAWLIYQPRSSCQNEMPFTFVYFHGNAGNIGHRLENIRDMHQKLKINILIVDYRGYGDSEDGDGPSQKGFMMDAQATYRWLVERIRNPKDGEEAKMSEDRILLFGRSIGGAVAIRLMADLLREKLRLGAGDALPLPAGLVLENTFTALRDMAVELFPFLSFVNFLLRPPLVFDPWDSNDSLDFLTKNHSAWCCCLLSGLQDQIVPPAQMRTLRNILKAREPKVLKYFTFKNGGHNDTPTRGGAEYWMSFQKFMALVVASEEERRQDSAAQEKSGKDD